MTAIPSLLQGLATTSGLWTILRDNEFILFSFKNQIEYRKSLLRFRKYGMRLTRQLKNPLIQKKVLKRNLMKILFVQMMNPFPPQNVMEENTTRWTIL